MLLHEGPVCGYNLNCFVRALFFESLFVADIFLAVANVVGLT